MKKYLMFIFTLMISLHATAKVGIGISAQSDDNNFYLPNEGSGIYFPIDVTSTFRIEPLLRYSRRESESSAESTDDYKEFGIGLFSKQMIKDNINLLYGARVGYVKSKGESKTDYYDYKTDMDGYSIAPTIGFEYFIINNFSIGAEAAIQYQNLDGDRIDSDPVSGKEKSDASRKSTKTVTSVDIRFYF